MLIDEFLPVYDATEYHEIDIHAPVDQVYATVRALDMSDSTIIRWLFLMRGIPALLLSDRKQKNRLGLTLDGLLKSGFILLGEKPRQEIVLGLVGRFWTASGCIQRLDANEFANFNRQGYAKAAWNFYLSQHTDALTRLATETRVYCTDKTSRRRFGLYWLFIGPFSSLIRREMLRVVKQKAEKFPSAA